MALNGYFGLPGSGKSYSVVEYVIIPALKRGRHVVTNIPLQVDLLEQVFGGQVTQLPLDVLDREQLADLLPHGCVAVIDEVWRRWPSGQKVHRASKADLQLLKEHRHRVDSDGNAMQVVLVSQAAADLAMWVRQLIAHSFHMDKLDTIGLDKRFSIKVYKGCPVGDKIPAKLLVRDAVGTYKPEIYQYYSSATQSQASDLSVGDEKAMDKRANIWGGWQMRSLMLFIPASLIGSGLLLTSFLSIADPEEAPKEEPPVAEQRLRAAEPPPLPGAAAPGGRSAAAPAGRSAAPGAKSSAPAYSAVWRVVGFMKHRDKDARSSPGAWPSTVGYGDLPEGSGMDSSQWLGDLVVLRSALGLRTVPVSDCRQMPASRYYSCTVDGETATPWTGMPADSVKAIGDQPLKEAKQAVPVLPVTSGATQPAKQA